jgi:hypothetical protein
MSLESEVILARYSTVEKEADKLGRIIGVRRLKPSEQTKISGMCSDLTGSEEVVADDTGEKIFIPHRMPLLIAASVCLIIDYEGEKRIPFPRNRAELDAIYDRLDVEGLTAASTAMGRLNQTEKIVEPKDEAKN